MAELGSETDIYEFRVGVSGCRVGYCKAGFGEKWLTPRRLRGGPSRDTPELLETFSEEAKWLQYV
jgi:hypothetical protein